MIRGLDFSQTGYKILSQLLNPVIVSSFSPDKANLSSNQVIAFHDATTIVCETKSVLLKLLEDLGISSEQKQIYYLFEEYGNVNGKAGANQTIDVQLNIYENVLQLAKNPKERIVIVSDEGLPNISDPFAGLVRQLVDNNFKVKIQPNVSSIISATMVDASSSNGYLFGGMLDSKPNPSRQDILKNASVVSEIFPVIFLLVADSVAEMQAIQDDLVATFGEHASVTLLFNTGLDGEELVRGNIQHLTGFWANHLRDYDSVKTLCTMLLNNVGK